MEQMKTVLESIVDMDTKKGGARRWGAVHAAATLAVEANALGFGEGERAPEESGGRAQGAQGLRAPRRGFGSRSSGAGPGAYERGNKLSTRT